MLDRAGQIGEDFRQQPGQRQRTHPHRIDGEEQEAAVRIEQAAAIGHQRREVILQPPHLALRPAPELGRIEDDPVIAPAPPHLARGELGGIIDDPAHRPPVHPRKRGIGPGLRH